MIRTIKRPIKVNKPTVTFMNRFTRSKLPKTVGLVQHLGENAVKHGRYK